MKKNADSDVDRIKTIYVFGNPDYQPDSVALHTAAEIQKIRQDLNFIYIKPNEDLPFADQDEVTILDAIEGLPRVTALTENDLDRLIMAPRSSVHEFDLGFQLKYLRKIGKLRKVIIIGIPMNAKFTLDEVINLLP